MNLKKNKVTFIVGLLIGCLVLGAGGYFGVTAYETDKEIAKNTVSIGENVIELHEDPYNPPEELVVGDNTFSKTPRIQNTGNIDCYVRMYFRFDDDAIANMSGVATTDANVFYSAALDGKPTTNTSTKVNADSFIDHLPDGWVYIPATSETSIHYTDESYDITKSEGELIGGYFYYTKALAPGETTTPLAKAIVTTFVRDNDIKSYNIIVYAESIQVRDHNGELFTGGEAWRNAWIENLARNADLSRGQDLY